MRWMFLLFVAACGGAAPEPYGIAECSASCERAKNQLINDFSATKVECWDAELFFATSKDACYGIFEKRWGVVFTP